MKLIELGGKYGSIIGNYAQVSDEDYEELNKSKWHVIMIKRPNFIIRYACRAVNKNHPAGYMHKVILLTDKEVDHKDHNGLNNQRENIRIATHSQNQANRKSSGRSKYKGVSIISRKSNNGIREYWRSAITKDRKTREKYCKSEIEAALWYNEQAIKIHGEFAYLNVIE